QKQRDCRSTCRSDFNGRFLPRKPICG
ncbi:hypothetical protein D030_1798B, partial [Vibrio parahaemolyticus AQ3810]